MSRELPEQGASMAARVAISLAGLLAAAVFVGATRNENSPPPGVQHSALYVGGPPPGFTGGVGEDSCHACHFSEDLNEASGMLVVEGFPERYVGGRTYPLRVTVSRREMALAGFQLAVRSAADSAQAGRIELPEEEKDRLAVAVDRGVQYAFQLAPGATPQNADTARWSMLWTAPEAIGAPIVLHVAGNAADGDDTAMGDFVYTTALESTGSDD